MKRLKKAVLQTPNHFDSVDEKEQNKYLNRIAYWIGYYIIEFNSLEALLTDSLAERIGGGDINDYAYIFLTGVTFGQKVDLLNNLYGFGLQLTIPPGRASELKTRRAELLAELKDIAKIRNTVAHANYRSLDKNGNVIERTRFAGHEVEEHWVEITRDFLVDEINRLSEFTERFEDLNSEFE